MMTYENGQHSAAIKRLLRKQHQSAQNRKKRVSRIIIFLYTDTSLLHDSCFCEYFCGTRLQQKRNKREVVTGNQTYR